jgi:hypothetical protein
MRRLTLDVATRVRERLVSQRTGIINQIRAFMLERGIAVRQGIGFLRMLRVMRISGIVSGDFTRW